MDQNPPSSPGSRPRPDAGRLLPQDAIFDLLPCAILRFDEDGQCVYVNAETERLTGVRRENLVGRIKSDAGLWPEDESWPHRLGGVFAGADCPPTVSRLSTPRGPLVVESHLFPERDADGRVRSAIEFWRDNAELRRKELELNARIRDISLAHERQVASAAHAAREWRRPLQHLQGLLATMSSTPDEAAREALIGDMADTCEQLLRALDLSAEFDRVSRPEGSWEWVDLEAVAIEMSLDWHDRLERAGARVTVGALPGVMGDRAQFRRLFSHLIGAALRSSGTAPNIEITGRRNRDRVLVRLEHGGHPFRFDRAAVAGAAAPGLWSNRVDLHLAICRRIVETHGGRIWPEPASEGRSSLVIELSETRFSAGHAPESRFVQ